MKTELFKEYREYKDMLTIGFIHPNYEQWLEKNVMKLRRELEQLSKPETGEVKLSREKTAFIALEKVMEFEKYYGRFDLEAFKVQMCDEQA